MKPVNLFASLRFAADGFMHVVRSHGHMRLLLIVAALVLAASLALHVDRTELVLLVIAIALVISAELLNSAVEAVVDLTSPGYHPLAKVAKDVGGAGVLVSVCAALFIAGAVFLRQERLHFLTDPQARPPVRLFHVAGVGAALLVLLVILGKFFGGRGSLTRGGLVSFHSAVSFFLFASIWYVTRNAVAAGLALALALLVSQSRVEAGFHSLREVLFGALLALAISFAVFQFLPA